MSILGHVVRARVALVAGALVALGAADALAFGHKQSSYGSYGSSSSGSYGSSSSGSYGSSSGSYSSGSYGSSSSGSYASSSSGGRPGLFARWHARKAAKASSGSSSSGSYGSYASYGSSGSSSSGSYGSHGSSGSSGGSYGGGYSAPVEYYSAPVEMGVPVESPTPADAGASIRVTVPADAIVYVNDSRTTSTGTERSYISRGLRSGMSYSYDLRVEFTKDGKTVTESKVVSLAAGQDVNLAFGGGQTVAATEPVKTQLTLHVPADAKVTLAGAATKQSGELRTFSTATLAAGQEWDGYVVRVELNRDGKTIVEEKTLKITGGDSYELSFDMAGDAATMASIN